jgi:hypothetical protein
LKTKGYSEKEKGRVAAKKRKMWLMIQAEGGEQIPAASPLTILPSFQYF